MLGLRHLSRSFAALTNTSNYEFEKTIFLLRNYAAAFINWAEKCRTNLVCRVFEKQVIH